MQVSVDISTPASAFEAVEAAAVAHFKANPHDFSGEKMIIANIAGDPLKYMLCVWWEYAYPGQPCTNACFMLCMVSCQCNLAWPSAYILHAPQDAPGHVSLPIHLHGSYPLHACIPGCPHAPSGPTCLTPTGPPACTQAGPLQLARI